MRALLDTCVLFDIVARRMPFEDSCRLFMPQAFGDLELWVSAKSYTDIFYVMRKQAASADIQQALMKTLDRFNVCSVDKSALNKALGMKWPDFEDCLISVCAEKVGADAIITRDVKGFGSSSVPAYSPTQVFELLEQQGICYEDINF